MYVTTVARGCEDAVNSREIKVVRRPGAFAIHNSNARGLLHFAGRTWPCVMGSGGIRTLKREGDGATPRGKLQIGQTDSLRGWYRPNRLSGFTGRKSGLASTPTNLGWCDDPSSANYNRPVNLPFMSRHELMNRNDRLYDIVIVLNWNIKPRIRNRGSAIFWHLTKNDEDRMPIQGTEGCIALSPVHFRQVLSIVEKTVWPEAMSIG
jgi:L,D-peptidoglycan transpeptidase YkuD (ErfK/YbiS/YcfS/YnhG family)